MFASPTLPLQGGEQTARHVHTLTRSGLVIPEQ